VKALFWLLALFALAVAVALGARYNDGYVLLVMPPWRAEISLNLFIVAFALFASFTACCAPVADLWPAAAGPRISRTPAA
jgi:HemY protein